MKPILFKVTARFVSKDTGKPVHGDEYDVWLYDQDPITDDKMGKGKLEKDGRVEITCDLSDASSLDSPAEKYPDLYFILLKHGNEVFRSRVFEDTSTFVENPFSSDKKGIIVHLGEFKI